MRTATTIPAMMPPSLLVYVVVVLVLVVLVLVVPMRVGIREIEL